MASKYFFTLQKQTQNLGRYERKNAFLEFLHFGSTQLKKRRAFILPSFRFRPFVGIFLVSL
jgi:hypothetical protein